MADENYNSSLLSRLKEKKRIIDEFNRSQNQYGVSLVEMMAVICIIAIICTIALMQFGSSKKQLSRQNVAQELKVAFERARFDSVKRRAEVVSGVDYRARVTVNQNSFTIVTDANQNGVLTDAADSKTTDLSGQGISINSTLTLPYTVYFNKRGEVSDLSSPSFLVCSPSCTISNGVSDANPGNANLVLVTPSGTVNLLTGGSSAPVFAAPANISTVSNTNSIKNEVIITGN